MDRQYRAFRQTVFLSLLAVASCDSPTGPKENLPVTRLAQGSFANAASPQRVVVRTQQELGPAWAIAFPGSPVSLPPHWRMTPVPGG